MPLGIKYGGRRKGTPNKATLEKRAKAAAAQMAAADAPLEMRELAKDTLVRIMAFCEGAVAACRPTTEAETAAGKAINPDGDWGRTLDWAKLWAWCSDKRAAYESPKLLGVAIAPAPPSHDQVTVIDLDVFQGGHPVPPALPAPAARKDAA